MVKKVVITLPDEQLQMGKKDEIAIFYKLCADIQGKAPDSYLSAIFSNELAQYFAEVVDREFWPDIAKDLGTAERKQYAAEDQLRQNQDLLEKRETQLNDALAELERVRETHQRVDQIKEDHRNALVRQIEDLRKELALQQTNVADLEDDLVEEQRNHEEDKTWYEAEIRRLKALLYDLEHADNG